MIYHNDWNHLGATLVSFWNHSGIILGPYLDHIGTIVGKVWDHRGTILGRLWDHIGAIMAQYWDHIGTIVVSTTYENNKTQLNKNTSEPSINRHQTHPLFHPPGTAWTDKIFWLPDSSLANLVIYGMCVKT